LPQDRRAGDPVPSADVRAAGHANTPADFAAVLHDEIATGQSLVERLGVKLD